MVQVATQSWNRRRENRRDCTGELIQWSRHEDEQVQRGWLNNQSSSGLSFMSEYGDLPRKGEAIDIESDNERKVKWTVTRTRPLNQRLALIACARAETERKRTETTTVGPGEWWRFADRHDDFINSFPVQDSKVNRERRQSARWLTNKPVQWLPAGGRKLRDGYIIERSLSGMAIQTSDSEIIKLGTRIRAGTRKMAERHGFRTGIVRRVENSGGKNTICVEILS